MNRWIFLLAVSLAQLGPAEVAVAQPLRVPLACQGDRESKAFHAGKGPGREIASRARAEAHGCGDVARIAAAVTRSLRERRLPPHAAPQALCRHAGTIEGLYEELGAIWEGCDTPCCERGVLVAEMTAQLYCDISIALGGIGVAGYLPSHRVPGCGAQFETCCDARFTDATRRHESPEGACLPYTEGPFEEPWTQARHNLCVYELPPEPTP